MGFFSSGKKPGPKDRQTAELRRMGYKYLSPQLQRGFDRDLKRSGGRIVRGICPICGCTTLNGRCPNCAHK